MDPDPNPANLLRTLFVAKSRSEGRQPFYVCRLGWVKILEQKKSFSVSDLAPNPRFESGSKPDLKLLFRIGNTASNEHILDKVMVKYRGINHSSYKDVSPMNHSLTCSLF
jgi:hypothetical protein